MTFAVQFWPMTYYLHFWLLVKLTGNLWNATNRYSTIVTHGKLCTIRELKAGFSIILAYIRLPRMMNHSNKEEISSEMFSVANTTCAAYVSNRLNMFVCVNMCWEITNNSHLMHLSYTYVWSQHMWSICGTFCCEYGTHWVNAVLGCSFRVECSSNSLCIYFTGNKSNYIRKIYTT